jgi:uncharacterized protein (TIGR02421 family)
MLPENQLKRLTAVDDGIVKISKDIKVLGALSWPLELQQQFLDDWQAKRLRLPEPVYDKTSFSEHKTALQALMRGLDSEHPLEVYLKDTAESYLQICTLLESVGEKHTVTEISSEIYGRPGDSLSGGGAVDNLDAARHFIDISNQYRDQIPLEEIDYYIPAGVMQRKLEERIPVVINGHKIAIVLDDHLASKAAAGATRIRLRNRTTFSEMDLEQLLQHEAFVHSLTALNGRCQPHFQSLGLAAPRTTGAQEGLATFAELITGAIDIARITRIALRIVAVDMALNGADFIEVFKFFLDQGQSDIESFNSAMRVFRGVPVGGGDAFTKDTVYLHGLMEVHTFFRWALRHQRLEYCNWFAAGRMTITDVIRLAPFFRDGTLAPPRYLPPWLTRTNGLAAYLAFSVFANQIRIDALDAGSRVDRLNEVGI